MFNEFRKEIDFGGRPLIMETGKIARQADGAVMVRLTATEMTRGDPLIAVPRLGLQAPALAQGGHPRERRHVARR